MTRERLLDALVTAHLALIRNLFAGEDITFVIEEYCRLLKARQLRLQTGKHKIPSEPAFPTNSFPPSEIDTETEPNTNPEPLANTKTKKIPIDEILKNYVEEKEK